MKTFKQWLNERVVKFSDKKAEGSPILVLTNPTKSELTRLTKFAQKHELTISNWIDSNPPTEWRTIFDIIDEVWYVWAGFMMHSEIMWAYQLPSSSSVLGRIHVKGNKIEVNFDDHDNRPKPTAIANQAVRKYMKDNNITGKVLPR